MATPNRVAVVVNPRAGGGDGAALAEPAAARLRAAGCQVRLLVPADLDQADAAARAQVREGVEALVVVGGDGMVHLGVGAVGGTEVGLAVVPCGTGNDFARTRRHRPRDRLDALEPLCRGLERRVDLLEATTATRRALVATVVAVGFDARVALRADRMKRVPGHLRYLVAIGRELRRFPATPVEVAAVLDDGTPYTSSGERLLVAVGVTPYYGGGLAMLPDADPVDGVGDMVEIAPVTRRRLLRLFPRLYTGTHVGLDVVTMSRVREVRLSAPEGTGTPVAVGDGESLGRLPVTLRLLPGALRLFDGPVDAA